MSDLPVFSAFAESEQVAELYAGLVEAFGELRNVATDSTADTGTYTYSYMSLGSIMRAIREPLALAGLAVVQAPAIEAGQGGNRVSVTTRIIHRTGQWIEASVSIAIGSNAGAQVVGSAITYARRYGVTALLGIASGDDDDGAGANSAPPAYEQQAPRDLTIGKAKQQVLAAMDGDLENTRLFWLEMNGSAPGPFSPDGIAAQVALIPEWLKARTPDAVEAEGPEGEEPEADRDPPAVETPAAPPTPTAMRRLMAAVNDTEMTDDDRHAWATRILGREITTFNDLTRADVSMLTEKATS